MPLSGLRGVASKPRYVNYLNQLKNIISMKQSGRNVVINTYNKGDVKVKSHNALKV
jgi:hypothetical protein